MKKHVLHKTEIRSELLKAYCREIRRFFLFLLITTPLLLLLSWAMYRLFILSPSKWVILDCALAATPLLGILFFLLEIASLLLTVHRVRKGHVHIVTDTLIKKKYVEVYHHKRSDDLRYRWYFSQYGSFLVPHEADMDVHRRHSENEYRYPWGQEGDSFYLILVGNRICRVYNRELFEIVD